MKNGMPEHYWRIHNRVARRTLLDMPDSLRTVIANDTLHETPEYQAFEKKLTEDTKRLYEDPSYYDNHEFTFRVPKFDEGAVPQPQPRHQRRK